MCGWVGRHLPAAPKNNTGQCRAKRGRGASGRCGAAHRPRSAPAAEDSERRLVRCGGEKAVGKTAVVGLGWKADACHTLLGRGAVLATGQEGTRSAAPHQAAPRLRRRPDASSVGAAEGALEAFKTQLKSQSLPVHMCWSMSSRSCSALAPVIMATCRRAGGWEVRRTKVYG